MTNTDILAAVPTRPRTWSVTITDAPTTVTLSIRCDNMGEHATWQRNRLHRLTPHHVKMVARGMIDRMELNDRATRAMPAPPQWRGR